MSLKTEVKQLMKYAREDGWRINLGSTWVAMWQADSYLHYWQRLSDGECRLRIPFNGKGADLVMPKRPCFKRPEWHQARDYVEWWTVDMLHRFVQPEIDPTRWDEQDMRAAMAAVVMRDVMNEPEMMSKAVRARFKWFLEDKWPEYTGELPAFYDGMIADDFVLVSHESLSNARIMVVYGDPGDVDEAERYKPQVTLVPVDEPPMEELVIELEENIVDFEDSIPRVDWAAWGGNNGKH